MDNQQPSGSLTKFCRSCGEEKPLSEFWFSEKTGKYLFRCRACDSIAKRKYKQENRVRVNETARLWRKQHPEKPNAAQDRWRAKNPGLAAQRAREWRAANLERARAKQREVNRNLKDAVYEAYGGYRCACCGETISQFLSLDHIDNDGAEHRRRIDRRKIYKWLRDNGFPPGYQILCMNCNFGKARNGGICPHEEGSTTIP